MIAVIFEVIPHAGRNQHYVDLALELAPLLATIDGFISIERFTSITTPGKILSLSFWRDEQAITHWRNTEQHRAAQHMGREEIFEQYRLRIATVNRDYGLSERQEAPADSQQRHINVA